MELKVKRTCKVILELEEWEAQDLKTILVRLETHKTVSKSEFSMREKSLGRKISYALADKL